MLHLRNTKLLRKSALGGFREFSGQNGLLMRGYTRHECVSTAKNALPCVLEMLRHLSYVNVFGKGVTYVVFPWDLLNYNFALLNSLLDPKHVNIDVPDLP